MSSDRDNDVKLFNAMFSKGRTSVSKRRIIESIRNAGLKTTKQNVRSMRSGLGAMDGAGRLLFVWVAPQPDRHESGVR